MFENITTDPLSLFTAEGIEVSVLRLDKIHPVISGNKWFKLRYYLEEAKEKHKTKIISFGGAYSNHIVATAAACQLNGFLSAGIIRGEEPRMLSATLLQAKEYGMSLYFTPRSLYGEKRIPGELNSNDTYVIPEGGFGGKGAKGAAEITGYAKNEFTHYCCATGTGTMLAGLINSVLPSQTCIGINVLKNKDELQKNVLSLLIAQRQWQIIDDYHFGGYAKHNPVLLNFMNEFYTHCQIPSDFVYTGKLFYAISDLIKNHFFPPGSRLLLIHSGGLQGNASLKKGTLIY